jgi:hypothetical protein
MYDASDRFLHQLAADRRASLLRSGEASTKRPFRRALRAGLARVGLADRNRVEAPSLHRPRPALTNSEGTCRIQEGLTGSAPGVGEPAPVDVVSPSAGASATRLRHGAQQA